MMSSSLLTSDRDRVALSLAAYGVLQSKMDALRLSVLDQAERIASKRHGHSVRQIGELTRSDIEQALAEVADKGPDVEVCRRSAPPPVTDELGFWLDRRLYDLRSTVRGLAKDIAAQKDALRQSVPSGDSMEQAWQAVWTSPEWRRKTLVGR